ncbi:AfsR/SARP family transcriptional regulator [Streptomyces asoensis]|uniref:AfsR/SARP family transcriptional regulator n=1 Tax=Streptomyces asoensis TaxID=249586 RepID=UPI0033ECC07D
MGDERVDTDTAMSPRTAQAWRIAELEREVRELRRTNRALRRWVTGTLSHDDAAETDGHDLAAAGLPDGIGDGVPDRGTDGAEHPKHPEPAEPPGRDHPAPPPAPAHDTRPARRRPPQTPAPRPAVAFRALGPIEALVGGRPVDLGAPKQRALLALLVSTAGRPVPCDVIVEELWTGHPPPAAVSSLHAYVANLRRVLEPGRAPRTQPTVLRTHARGYLLDGRAVEVDVHRFSAHAVAGWQALDRGDAPGAVREFEGALALWRGPAYAEVADTALVRPDAARLEELRLSVAEGRCAALLAAGAHEIAVAELEAFVPDHPLREYGCELLSLALYRAGRQADALAVLRANQRYLARELGIDPRPALRRLEEQILNHAPALDWRAHPAASLKTARRPAPAADQRAPHRTARRQPPHHTLLPRTDLPRTDLLRAPLPAEL